MEWCLSTLCRIPGILQLMCVCVCMYVCVRAVFYFSELKVMKMCGMYSLPIYSCIQSIVANNTMEIIIYISTLEMEPPTEE
jgi:hypothetical protein